MTTRVPRVLSIAGTDPTGGAGIHADLKSIAANGGYGMAVVTALVAQNTHGVRSVHTPPVSFLREQLDAVSDDVTIDAVKIGMLGDADIVATVSSWLEDVAAPIVVLDPVMVATSGDRLLDSSAEQAVRDMIRQVDLVTPNLPELATLLDEPVADDWPTALDQGRRLSLGTGSMVLVKGGHLAGSSCSDALIDTGGGRVGPTGCVEIDLPRVSTANTHGTGCSMSSAIATLQARHDDWPRALSDAKRWLTESLLAADELRVGTGRGPINHFHSLWTRASGSDR